MGFSSIGQIIVTARSNSSREVIGPVLPTNVWTHVVSTYSTTNGTQLYLNGTFINGTGPMNISASNQVNIITLVNSMNGSCVSQSIVPSPYNGLIDEFRVYSRELSLCDIYSLAYP
jgi:hypothetical protein